MSLHSLLLIFQVWIKSLRYHTTKINTKLIGSLFHHGACETETQCILGQYFVGQSTILNYFGRCNQRFEKMCA